jgi:hypothetical protein
MQEIRSKSAPIMLFAQQNVFWERLFCALFELASLFASAHPP